MYPENHVGRTTAVATAIRTDLFKVILKNRRVGILGPRQPYSKYIRNLLKMDRNIHSQYVTGQNLEDIIDVFIEVVRWIQYIQTIKALDVEAHANPLKYWDPNNDPGSGGDQCWPPGVARWATPNQRKLLGS